MRSEKERKRKKKARKRKRARKKKEKSSSSSKRRGVQKKRQESVLGQRRDTKQRRTAGKQIKEAGSFMDKMGRIERGMFRRNQKRVPFFYKIERKKKLTVERREGRRQHVKVVGGLDCKCGGVYDRDGDQGLRGATGCVFF